MHFRKKLTLSWILFLVSTIALAASAARPGVAPSAEEICPLLPGSQLPEITLQKIDGSDLDLAEAVARKPTILIFYRGGW